MTQHLIRTLTDSTSHTFTHITQARENETFQVVDAESKEEAEKMAKKTKRPLSYYTLNGSKVTVHELPSEETLQEMFGKDFRKNRK
ncbi:DUF1381 domain-containing protein [Staphylococcus xylosus]